MTDKLSPNSVALIALAVEYCRIAESAPSLDDRDEFIGSMLKLLPRLYITASDVDDYTGYSEYFIDAMLDEDTYNAVRDGIALLIDVGDALPIVIVDVADRPFGGCRRDAASEGVIGVAFRKDAVGGDRDELILTIPDQIESRFPDLFNARDASGRIV